MIRQVHAERAVRGDAREDGLHPLEVAEHRVAEDRRRSRPAWPHDCEPGLGPGALRLTSLPGSGTGSGRSSIWSNSEKIAAFAPMPSASDTTATVVTSGVLRSARTACGKRIFGMVR